jgi:peptidase M16 domain protein
MKQPLSAPAPIINLGTPITHILPNGLTLLIVENHRLPQVTLRLLLDDQPTLEGDKKGVYDLLSLLVGNGSANINKEAFNEEIDYMAVNINILPNGVYAQSLSKFFPRVLELIADAALHPNFEEEEMEREKARIVQSLKAGENNAEVIMKRVQQALRYTTAHPYGEYITESTISALTLTDVYDYYRSHFQPNHAYLVVAGDVNPDEVVRLVSSCFADWQAVNTPLVKLYEPENVAHTEINLIDLPTAVQSEIRLTNLITLSMNHPDYFPMLIANSILGGDFGSYINMNLREAHGYTYGATSGFKIDKWTKGAFSIKTKVSNAVTAPAIIETLNEIKRIQTQEVSAEKLSQAKAQYIGQFVMATERPQSTANYAINIRTQQLPADFYKNYIASLQNVTQADVQRVANTYFMLQNMRIIVVGKADEIKSSLEKAVFENYEMPVYQYNKYAEAKKD